VVSAPGDFTGLKGSSINRAPRPTNRFPGAAPIPHLRILRKPARKGARMRVANPTDSEKPLFAEWLGIAHPASEQMYFLNMPVAHVVAYEDHQRETRLARTIALTQRSIRQRIPA
jgi:hypothetical protein